ncbi:BspA family leucine-rich repeat surface protein [Enterocloster bolteae]|nr:BspA family leucine-rich repeat surface protein [Clostridium sp. MCC328]MBT9828978.1 BspA family leucine-rich repeat surface protein [Enterocloster bolteae]
MQTLHRCTSLKDISPLANWNVENVTDMYRMFFMCRSLSDASAINDWNIQNVTNFQEMFYDCPFHPEFTKRAGTWKDGTFTPRK